MPSDNGEEAKSMGTAGGSSRAQRGWKRPLFSARNRRSEEKERPLRCSSSQADGSRLCGCPLRSQQMHIGLMAIARRGRSSETPTPRNLRGEAADYGRIKTNLPVISSLEIEII